MAATLEKQKASDNTGFRAEEWYGSIPEDKIPEDIKAKAEAMTEAAKKGKGITVVV